MTHLRKLTLDEIARRNYTESTTRVYIRVIADFALYFHRSPDQLGPDQVREYTAHLFRDLKLSDNTVNQRVGALRFFFRKVLKRYGDGDDMPYPKKKIHLPISPPKTSFKTHNSVVPSGSLQVALSKTLRHSRSASSPKRSAPERFRYSPRT